MEGGPGRRGPMVDVTWGKEPVVDGEGDLGGIEPWDEGT